MSCSNWRTICSSLECNPAAWSQPSLYSITHESGFRLWVGNGWLLMTHSSDSITSAHLSLFGRWMVWRAFKKWKRWQLPRVLAGIET